MSNCHFRELHVEGNCTFSLLCGGSFPSVRLLDDEVFSGTDRLSLFVRDNGGSKSVGANVGVSRKLHDNWRDALTCTSAVENGFISGHIYQNNERKPLRVTVCRDCCLKIVKSTEREENGITPTQWAMIFVIVAVLLLAVVLGCVFGLRK